MSTTLYTETPELSQQAEHTGPALMLQAQVLDLPEAAQHSESDADTARKEPIGSRQARTEPHWRRRAYDSLLAVGGVALLTGVIALTHLYTRIPTIALVYLLVIVALAAARGLYAAVLASLLAVIAFDYFLVSPAYTPVVLTLEDALTLVVFLVTALLTSEVASVLRKRTQEARRREQELWLLYEQAEQLAALKERQRLARELHDSVSQALYGISLGANTIREALESNEPEQALASTEYVLGLAGAGLAEMRALIFELRPESLETEGLVAAFTKQVAVLRTRHKLKVEVDLGEEPDLCLEKKEALYRIAQEAVHNIVKHAHASTVFLRLARQEQEIILQVRDNGRGFDPTGSFPGHLGLRSMQERIERVGGALTIESAPGQGTGIQASVAVGDRSPTKG